MTSRCCTEQQTASVRGATTCRQSATIAESNAQRLPDPTHWPTPETLGRHFGGETCPGSQWTRKERPGSTRDPPTKKWLVRGKTWAG
jgi:hypothetical protein